MKRSFDHASFAEAFAGVKQQWVSYGLVDADGGGDAHSVDLENSSDHGPMINVTLQPSGVKVRCRVATMVAGDGEAEWYPFSGGDEVLVAIPEGHERAGCIIVGRMNQSLDVWPKVVAGQDSTKNTFGFRRMRTPFVVETAASYLIRSALTGSQIGIDPNGNVIINDGDRGALMLGPEAIGLSSGDQETFVTIFPPSKEVFIGAGSTTFDLKDGSESKFISQAAISFATAGSIPNGHAVTAEQVVALLINVIAQLCTLDVFKAGSPLSASVYTLAPPTSCQTAIASVLGPALLAMAAAAPVGPAPGGEFLEFQAAVAPPLLGPAGATAAAMANPLAAVDVTGAVLGFGKSGFKI